MNTQETSIETLFEKVEVYSQTSIELLKLKALDKSAEVFSTLAIKSVLVAVLAIFAMLINIGIALWIGDLLHKTFYGFFVLAGCYGILVFILRSYLHLWVKVPVSNFIISKIQKTL